MKLSSAPQRRYLLALTLQVMRLRLQPTRAKTRRKLFQYILIDMPF